ncbi:MAG TPA: hypothetical protein VMM27_10715 [Casimicrobiaceae bacterium]|nr:hypothetical protein [Casimicrobiaceae bacterium]
METRNHYWLLDCILALTAIALGTTALCSFAGVAESESVLVFAAELLACVAAVIASSLFIGFAWHDHRANERAADLRAHQELHAAFMKRIAPRIVETPVVAPEPVAADESPKADEVPETLLVTSLTDAMAERSVQRRQQARRAVEAVAAAA